VRWVVFYDPPSKKMSDTLQRNALAIASARK
jgi:hypothetical protein